MRESTEKKIKRIARKKRTKKNNKSALHAKKSNKRNECEGIKKKQCMRVHVTEKGKAMRANISLINQKEAIRANARHKKLMRECHTKKMNAWCTPSQKINA